MRGRREVIYQRDVRSLRLRLIVNVHVRCLTPSGLAFGEFPENLKAELVLELLELKICEIFWVS